MKKKDLYVIIGILTAAIILFGGIWIYQNKIQKKTEMAQVLYNGNAVMLEFDINEDAVYHLRGDYGKFDVEVKDGKFRMTNVECPNHNCEGMGWQPDENFYLPIICIPNNVVVQLKDE